MAYGQPVRRVRFLAFGLAAGASFCVVAGFLSYAGFEIYRYRIAGEAPARAAALARAAQAEVPDHWYLWSKTPPAALAHRNFAYHTPPDVAASCGEAYETYNLGEIDYFRGGTFYGRTFVEYRVIEGIIEIRVTHLGRTFKRLQMTPEMRDLAAGQSMAECPQRAS